MSVSLILVAAVSGFTTYQPLERAPPRIEVVTDKGLMLELIVKCPQGSAIVQYSKVEGLFCGPKHGCGAKKDVALRRACGR